MSGQISVNSKHLEYNFISVVSKESVETGGVSKVSRLLKTECKMSPIRLFSKLNDMIRH